MNIEDILSRLNGVRKSGGGYIARCPAHEDKRPSLSINTSEDGRLLLKCHAGCSIEAIVGALGLSMKDLFSEDNPPLSRKKELVAIYEYPNGTQKLRYSDKSFTWRQPDNKGGWVYSRKGVPHSLYIQGSLEEAVAFALEGEKDADSLHKLGLTAVSGEDGAGPGKWRKEYTEQLRGRFVCIIPDHDQIGEAYAQEVAAALSGEAESVRVLDLTKVWPEIPEHGDVSDMIAALGPEETEKRLGQLMRDAKEWEPAPPAPDPFLSCFRTLDSFTEEEAKWLIPGWIPEGQITLLAADGGVGKTSLWCEILAAVSSGRVCLLDPIGHKRQAQKVAFLTTEDSVRKKLKKKLRLCGADMGNIITPDFLSDTGNVLRGLKFGSPEMARFIRHFRPALCVFDPVQGFVPSDLNMGSRNAMRDCMAPLITLGEETGTTFLVVVHTSKRKGAIGRDRIADSADLWDIARSVLMLGYTEEQGVRYLSNEKNNYSELQESILFSFGKSGEIRPEGTTWKRDREFTQEAALSVSAPKRNDCKEWIMREVENAGGDVPSKILEESAKQAGYSFQTLRRAKEELKAAGDIQYYTAGSAKNGTREWRLRTSIPV